MVDDEGDGGGAPAVRKAAGGIRRWLGRLLRGAGGLGHGPEAGAESVAPWSGGPWPALAPAAGAGTEAAAGAVPALLARLDAGEQPPAAELLPLVYGELRRTTSPERGPTTAAGGRGEHRQRRRFFAKAAETLRRAAVAQAREPDPPSRLDVPEVLAIDAALRTIEAVQPHVATVVKLRYFVGMTLDEAAEATGQGRAEVDHHWRFAKAWLHRELSRELVADVPSRPPARE